MQRQRSGAQPLGGAEGRLGALRHGGVMPGVDVVGVVHSEGRQPVEHPRQGDEHRRGSGGRELGASRQTAPASTAAGVHRPASIQEAGLDLGGFGEDVFHLAALGHVVVPHVVLGEHVGERLRGLQPVLEQNRQLVGVQVAAGQGLVDVGAGGQLQGGRGHGGVGADAQEQQVEGQEEQQGAHALVGGAPQQHERSRAHDHAGLYEPDDPVRPLPGRAEGRPAQGRQAEDDRADHHAEQEAGGTPQGGAQLAPVHPDEAVQADGGEHGRRGHGEGVVEDEHGVREEGQGGQDRADAGQAGGADEQGEHVQDEAAVGGAAFAHRIGVETSATPAPGGDEPPGEGWAQDRPEPELPRRHEGLRGDPRGREAPPQGLQGRHGQARDLGVGRLAGSELQEGGHDPAGAHRQPDGRQQHGPRQAPPAKQEPQAQSTAEPPGVADVAAHEQGRQREPAQHRPPQAAADLGQLEAAVAGEDRREPQDQGDGVGRGFDEEREAEGAGDEDEGGRSRRGVRCSPDLP